MDAEQQCHILQISYHLGSILLFQKQILFHQFVYCASSFFISRQRLMFEWLLVLNPIKQHTSFTSGINAWVCDKIITHAIYSKSIHNSSYFPFFFASFPRIQAGWNIYRQGNFCTVFHRTSTNPSHSPATQYSCIN